MTQQPTRRQLREAQRYLRRQKVHLSLRRLMRDPHDASVDAFVPMEFGTLDHAMIDAPRAIREVLEPLYEQALARVLAEYEWEFEQFWLFAFKASPEQRARIAEKLSLAAQGIADVDGRDDRWQTFKAFSDALALEILRSKDYTPDPVTGLPPFNPGNYS